MKTLGPLKVVSAQTHDHLMYEKIRLVERNNILIREADEAAKAFRDSEDHVVYLRRWLGLLVIALALCIVYIALSS